MENKAQEKYEGEIGQLYKVKYRYTNTDGWFKRKLVDLWLWIKTIL